MEQVRGNSCVMESKEEGLLEVLRFWNGKKKIWVACMAMRGQNFEEIKIKRQGVMEQVWGRSPLGKVGGIAVLPIEIN